MLPFDTVAHRTIFVDLTDWHSIEHTRERVASSARAIRAPGYQVSNPITQANASFKMRQSDDPRDRILAEMQERMAALESWVSPERGPRGGYPLARGVTIAHMLKRGDELDALELYRAGQGIGHVPAGLFIEALLNGDAVAASKLHEELTHVGRDEARQFVNTILSKRPFRVD
jgi:hypothetical protein